MSVQRHEAREGEVTFVYYFTAAGFASRAETKSLFNTLEKKLRTGLNDVGVVSIQDDPRATFRVPHPFVSVVYSPDRALVKLAEGMMSGVPFSLADGMMDSLVRRRARVALDALRGSRERGEEPPVMWRHLLRTDGGMEVLPDGTARPHRRGQG